MMDTISTAVRWPKWPYRGLNFYRESEAVLFGGRATDIERCAELLLRFGVKVLLLQGSSGSGKSSFIRAGLLPYLKGTTEADPHQQSFFLNADDSVIRCTTDPLRVIALTLLSAIDHTFQNVDPASPFTPGFRGERHQLSPVARDKIREKVTEATEGSPLTAHESLVEALAVLVADLPGHLILVLDQAEEVLTRSDGTGPSTDAASAFFRFLEDVYLQNIDVRIIVSLRTEFYGIFRDELAISDNRFSSKASRGGVEPFLLHPLRNPVALKRIILAPTETDKPYDFSIDDELADKIVQDLLEQLPRSSVTPALQVICASLYMEMRDDRRIDLDVYRALGEFRGIVRTYLEKGIAQSSPANEQEIESWHLLLYSLVSRQGGGTIVSLTEPVDVLEKRAAELDIPGPIGPRLLQLSRGKLPLVRAEPPANPAFFSLKHDVLAIILSRWFDEHDGAIRARQQERVINERLRTRDRYVFWGVIGGLVTAAIMIGAGVAWYAYDKGRTAYEARKSAVALRNAYVERAPEGNYRQVLLGTLATLKRLDERTEWYGLYRAPVRLRESMVATLRNVIPRVPQFTSKKNLAVGFDSEHGRIATLKQEVSTGGLLLEVMSMPSDDNTGDLPLRRAYAIPRERLEAVSQSNMFLTSTGFLEGIGPAVYLGGKLFYWDESGVAERDIVAALPPPLREPIPRAEFVGGQLHVFHFNWSAQNNREVRTLRFKSEDLKKRSIPAQSSYNAVPHRMGEPFPLLSDRFGPSSYQVGFSRGEVPNALPVGIPIEGAGTNEQDLGSDLLSARITRTDSHETIDVPISVVRRRPMSPLNALEPRRVTLALVENIDGLVLKADDSRFQIVEIGSGGRPARPREFSMQALPETDWDTSRGTSFIHPPIAASKAGDQWRAAWLSEDGVWAIRTENLEGGVAISEFARPLMSGEPGGVKLQYLREGRFLSLLQQRQWGSGTTVRVWDLRAEWMRKVRAMSEHELTDLACRILAAEGSTRMTEADVEQFQIPGGYRDPCGGRGKN